MNKDDIVYLSLLIFSIIFGVFYQKINNTVAKKKVGTLIGLLIIFTVSGVHILHPLITFLVNAFIITKLDPRICHKVSFAFTFLYLCFFRTSLWFGIPYASGHTNLVQMILTLKIVGLAFEVNSAYVNKTNKTNELVADGSKFKEQILEEEFSYVSPGFVDIFHYCFNYIGVLTGPYYRYKTFKDSFDFPFAKYVNCTEYMIKRLKYVPLYIIVFLVCSYIWPLSYVETYEFLNHRSWLYRYFYLWPQFLIFRMRIYSGLILSECVCIMAGFGAYPEKTKPKSGHGPSEDFEKMKDIISDPKVAEIETYNFDTVYNLNAYGSDFCVSYREGMKHWNMCVQYWLAVYVYKRFPYKKYRTVVTMLTSAVWHGVYTGYYLCIGTVPFVLIIEDIWTKILLKNNQNEKQVKIYQFILWFFKMHYFGYQAMALYLLEVNKVMTYYNSVFHMGLLKWIALYVIGLRLLKIKRRNEKAAGVETDGDKIKIK